MPNELKEGIEKEAKFNGRSLNAEIVDRLRKSIEPPIHATNNHVAEPQSSAYYTPQITDVERQMLALFRRMPVEKQLALLSLFK
jgi:hypothetical protein